MSTFSSVKVEKKALLPLYEVSAQAVPFDIGNVLLENALRFLEIFFMISNAGYQFPNDCTVNVLLQFILFPMNIFSMGVFSKLDDVSELHVYRHQLKSLFEAKHSLY